MREFIPSSEEGIDFVSDASAAIYGLMANFTEADKEEYVLWAIGEMRSWLIEDAKVRKLTEMELRWLQNTGP